MEYGQFCPIAKATEIIGEKWSLLVIRELLMGGRRFNELQRGLSLISPTMLSRRLKSLAEYGLVVKKKSLVKKVSNTSLRNPARNYCRLSGELVTGDCTGLRKI